VSKSTSVTARALYKVGGHWGVIRDGEKMGLETGPDANHGRCGGDVFRQTVPDTSSGDRKSSVADGEPVVNVQHYALSDEATRLIN